MHRDFGVADYEFDFDFENILNSKWQKLKIYFLNVTDRKYKNEL